jgi:hypothetical protein
MRRISGNRRFSFSPRKSVVTTEKSWQQHSLYDKEVVMTEELYSLRDCAETIGVSEHRIVYAHRMGHLAEPTHFVAGKRIYTGDDVKGVAKYFEVPLETVELAERRTP